MIERKIDAMHKRFGTCGVYQCRVCEHLISGVYRGKHYHKCELYGLSHGEGTDWRLSYQACGMFNMDVDTDRWTPVIELVKHALKPRPKVEGQIDMLPGEDRKRV